MSDDRSIWYFENTNLFDLFCPHKYKPAKEKHSFSNFKKDQFVYFQNQPAQTIYLVVDGRIKIGAYTEQGQEIVKAILTKGEIFGEMILAGEEKRKDFAQAMDNSVVCMLTLQEISELIRDHDTLSLKIYKLMGLRLRKLERRLESLVFKDAKTRIIEFLKETAMEKGQKVGYEVMIRNHLSHKDLASLTGTSRQTVTTVLNDLRNKNILTFDRRRILIRNLELMK